MRRLATVRVRITVGAVVVVGVALALAGVLLVVVHHARLEKDVETAARLRADGIASVLEQRGGAPNLDVATADASLAQVVDRAGNVVTASPNLRLQPPISRLRPPVGTAAARTVELAGRNDRFRLVAKSVSAGRVPYVVYVAQSLEPVEDSTTALGGLLAAGLPVLLLFVALITWLVTGRALGPVEAIRREVDVIGGGDLHRRVPAPGSDDEIGRLAETMNAMLARLEDADAVQRRFISDASHELRTPLTSIRAQVEVDLLHPERADWLATARNVLEDTRQMQDLVGDLLALAELDAHRSTPPGRAPVDLDDIVMAEVARARPTDGVAVDARAVSEAQVQGDEGELTRLVRNLFDNALRHAVSKIVVTLAESSGDGVSLTIANDGPLIPVADRQRIFERFARLDDARSQDAGGTGLGLAIVHEIVEHHDGTITVLDGPQTSFRVTLPAASHAAS